MEIVCVDYGVMKRHIFFSIIFLLGFFTLAAKGPVKISGTVTDNENEPLEFVTVKIQGINNQADWLQSETASGRRKIDF